MKTKTLLISLCVTGAVAATAAATQDALLPSSPPDDDAQKAAVFEKLQGPAGEAGDPCERQAWVERKTALQTAKADFFHDLAVCVNVEDPDERWDCVLEAFDAYDEAKDLAHDQFWARLDLCMATGGGYFAPEIDPDDFVEGISNPFWPQVPGVTLVYELETKEGELEEIHVEATGDTIEILGVECTVVRDTVWIDGELHEDTLDYYAEDKLGNVWYFGEIALNYEDGMISDVEGSWTAGTDDAHPGVLLWANPVVGTTYRQEFLLGEAEDAGMVLGLNASVDVPYGHFDNCLHTLDFSPLDPEAIEQKFYAVGIGTVLELDPATGERLELVDIVDGN